MCMRRHGRNENVKWRPILSYLTLSVTQESNDRSNWANSCGKRIDQASRHPYPPLMQESSNAQKLNFKKRMQIWKGSLTTPPYPYPLPKKIRIHPFKLIHVAYESIKQANILPLTTAKDLKRPNSKLHKENANMMCIRGHGRTALTIGGEGVRSEHHIRVPESLLVVATLHMGLQLHHLDELRQWHCRHSFLPPLCLCSDLQSSSTDPRNSSLRLVMQFDMLCFAGEEVCLGIPTCNLFDRTPQPVHKFLSPHSNTTLGTTNPYR